MQTIVRLPSPNDGAGGLLRLAEAFGADAVYDLIRLCRLAQGKGRDPGKQAMTALARRLVADEMRRRGVEGADGTRPPDDADPAAFEVWDAARQSVGNRLGYTTAALRANFYKVLSGGRPPEKRVHGPARRAAQ